MEFMISTISIVNGRDQGRSHASKLRKVASNKLQISLKSYFQSLLMTDSLTNVGLKFSASTTNDLFESVNFDLNHVNNKLEIFYVSP